MVCVAAAEGFTGALPTGTKHRSATARACGPERRTTASQPSPSGVAMAAMVSSNMKLGLHGAERGEAAAVNRTGAARLDGGVMLGRAIAIVLGETVARIKLVEFLHD